MTYMIHTTLERLGFWITHKTFTTLEINKQGGIRLKRKLRYLSNKNQ